LEDVVEARIKTAGLAVGFLVAVSVAWGTDRLVPSVYPSVQGGIDAAVDDDTVIVAPGTYYENIDFGGKSITLRSVGPNDPNTIAATVINGNGSGTVITFPANASAVCVVAGFTITNGSSSGDGGGIVVNNGTIDITNCIITGNSASRGGGIFNIGGKLMLTDCTFSGNWAAEQGGGVATESSSVLSSVTLTGCTFAGNSAGWGGAIHNTHYGAIVTNCTFSSNSATLGGAINTDHLYLGDLRLTNCTFSGNIADNDGGAVNNRVSGSFNVTNCIFWGNLAYREGPQIAHGKHGGTVSISYSCLQGGQLDIYASSGVLNWLSGNIDTDPRFADGAGGDYHLQSTAGRWNADTSHWVIDDNDSPCIDTGDPGSDWTEELWPHGKSINMGAFGGTPQASMSSSQVGNIADLDCSGTVDDVDLWLFADKWLDQELLLAEDLNRDGMVNDCDYAIFTSNWAWSQ
jgi:predicted outer membrane repeat protein